MFAGSYDLERVAFLPNQTIKMGNIHVKESGTENTRDFLYLIEDFEFQL